MTINSNKSDLTPTIHRLYVVKLINSPLFYIGRHSSKKDPDKDSYRGSGNWVTSIKDKSRLTIKTLEIYDSFEELKSGEQLYLDWYIDDPNNMNFNPSSGGFASGREHPHYGKRGELCHNTGKTGELSPRFGIAHTEESKTKMSAAHKGKTPSEETRIKLSVAKQGEHHNFAKLIESDVILILELYTTGNYTQKELGLKFGVSRATISDITTRRSWTHISNNNMLNRAIMRNNRRNNKYDK